MDRYGKKIIVNQSSLVDLKAELFRKQQEFKQTKDRSEAILTPLKIKKVFSVMGNDTQDVEVNEEPAVVANGGKDNVEEENERNKLDLSRKTLEAKAKLYDKLINVGVDSDEEEIYLVDFQRKKLEGHSSHNTENILKEELETNVTSEDDWVDYVDSLGRSRRCLRIDLPKMIEMDANLTRGNEMSAESHFHLANQDLKQDALEHTWSKDAEDGPEKPIHYQNVQFSEIRDHGVGYFAFSQDEATRQEQMDMLNSLRDKTVEQRIRRDKSLEQRKRMLKARLEKVKLRKKLKTGDTSSEEEHGHLEKSILADEGDKEAEVKPETALPNEAPVDLTSAESKEKQKVQSVRPWDVGKIGLKKIRRELSEGEWIRKKRIERVQEFAPPQLYFSGSSAAQSSDWMFQPTLYTNSNHLPMPLTEQPNLSANLSNIPLPTE